MQLLPVLALPLLLTQDGPAHLDGAWVLSHHGDAGPVGTALRTHYLVDLDLVPNMLTSVLLAVGVSVLGPPAAERLLVVGFVVLLVAGLRYALRGVDRRAGWLAVAALPFAGGHLVAYGFYAFCWGVALSLFVIGVALRARDGWTPSRVVALTALAFLTWTAHLLPWLVAVSVVGGLAAGRAVRPLRRRDGRAVLGLLGPPALAVAPTVLLSAVYAAGSGADPAAAEGGPSLARLWRLLSLYRPLVAATRLELVGSLLCAATLAVLTVHALRRRSPGGTDPAVDGPVDGPVVGHAGGPAAVDRRVLATAAAVTGLAVLLVPARVGSEFGFLPDRLAWFPPLLLVLFCATRAPVRPAARRLVAGLLVLATAAGVLVRLPGQLADQRAAAEVLTAAAQLAPGSTFVVLRLTEERPGAYPARGSADVLQHVSGLLAVEAGAVDVGHYEAVLPYFQVRFDDSPALRARLDPTLEGLEHVPPRVDLSAVAGELDAVVVLGPDSPAASSRTAQRVLADLRAHHRRVWTSEPSGLVEVWRLP